MRKNLVDAGDGFVGCMARARNDLRSELSSAVMASDIHDLGFVIYMDSIDLDLIDSFSWNSLARAVQRQLQKSR